MRATLQRNSLHTYHLGAHNGSLRTQISKGHYFLASSFPNEGYSINTIIARGENLYDNFPRKLRGSIIIAYLDNFIVLTMSWG